jgi:hypothetical protein
VSEVLLDFRQINIATPWLIIDQTAEQVEH